MRIFRSIARIAWLGLLALPASAQTIPDGVPQPGLPPALRGVGFDPELNAQIPLDTVFRDETGREVRLAEYAQDKPVVLAFVYYGCPMLCTQIERGVVGTLKTISFSPRRDYQVVFVSIDPSETSEMAREKKTEAMSRFGRPETAAGWYFLTGSAESVGAVTRPAKFRFTYDEKTKLFAHASGILILTPGGRVSRYFFGTDYPPRDVRLALVEASAGKIGTPTDHFLLYCFQYDPSTARYSAAILKIVRAGGILTIAGFLAAVVIFRRRETRARARHAAGADPNPQGAH